MPYPGIPNEKTEQMDRCVVGVMADSKMKAKYKSSKDRKSHAIAICNASIMSGKGNIDIDIQKYLDEDLNSKLVEYWKKTNTHKMKLPQTDINIVVSEKIEKGGEINMTDKKILKKDDEVVVEDAPKEEVVADTPKEVVVEDVASEKAVVEPAKISVEEPKVEEPVKEEVEPEEPKVEEKPSEEEKVEGIDFSKLETLLRKVVGETLVKVDEPKVDEPKVEDKPAEEPAEEVVDKVETSSMEKIEGAIAKVSEQLSDLEKRLKVIEEQPAPSKVVSPVVVSKSDVSEDANPRLTEINKRLDELNDLKESNPIKYSNNKMWNEAFKLMDERDSMMRKA